MPKVINKRKSRFITLDRSLMADKRLKSNHKILYALLCSLSESCDDVFPSYRWLAEQIGYDTEGKDESALYKFMSRNLEPLVDLGLVEIIKNEGYANDYAVNDYTPLTFSENPRQKCQDTSDKNVTPTPDKNVHHYIIEKEEVEKGEVRRETPQFFENEREQTNPTPPPQSKSQDDIVEFLETLHVVLSKQNLKSLQEEVILKDILRLKRENQDYFRADMLPEAVIWLNKNRPDWKYKSPYFKWKDWLVQVDNSSHSTESIHFSAYPKHLWQESEESDEEFEARCEFEEVKKTHRIERHYTQKSNTYDPNQWKKLRQNLFKISV